MLKFLIFVVFLSGCYSLGTSQETINELVSTSTLKIVSRSEWLAVPPSDELTDLIHPTPRVIIAHTATENCSTQATCTFRVRFIQTFHMESKGWDDIGYNFLIGGDGAVYEGRGWDKVGAHTYGHNSESICLAFIGVFENYAPPQRQIDAARLLIEEGERQGKFTSDYKLNGHRQFVATVSPGQKLFDIISKWPHFSEEEFFV